MTGNTIDRMAADLAAPMSERVAEMATRFAWVVDDMFDPRNMTPGPRTVAAVAEAVAEQAELAGYSPDVVDAYRAQMTGEAGR